MSSLYTIETAAPLPRVATSITLGAALLSKADDTAFNAAIVEAVNQYSALLHVNAMVFGCCSSFVFIIQDQVTAAALSVVSFTLMLFNVTLLLASLLRDLVVLTTKTYEFWFLTFLNVVGFGFAFLLDGNIHARQLIIRSFALASPLISGASTALVVQYTPRLQHTDINMGRGHEGDIVDVVVHCFTTMATFLAVKLVRSRKLMFPSREPIRNIRCDVYYPVCHLVPIITGQGPYKPSIQTIANQIYSKTTQLELKRDDIPAVVDANSTIMSVNNSRAICSLLPCINPIGYVGLVSSWFACVWLISGSNQTSQWTPCQMLVSITGVITTFVFAVIYVCHAPTVLLRRLCGSLDAWFVSLQFSIITLGVCDSLSWDERTLAVLPPWIWCNWIMILDTLTPLTKRRLRFRCKFVRMTLVMLFIYPVLLIYWLFYSDAPHLRNRVLFDLTLFGSTLCRFLWREIFRPADAFKLLKYSVQYRIGPAGLPTHPTAIYRAIQP